MAIFSWTAPAQPVHINRRRNAHNLIELFIALSSDIFVYVCVYGSGIGKCNRAHAATSCCHIMRKIWPVCHLHLLHSWPHLSVSSVSMSVSLSVSQSVCPSVSLAVCPSAMATRTQNPIIICATISLFFTPK